MHTTETNLEDVGVYTLSELSRRTTVPMATIRFWIKQKWLPVVKIDGKYRTVHMAKLAAEQAREDGRGKKPTWKLEPADHEDDVLVEEREHAAV